ncbi:MAG: amidase [Planctomycetota bacterium]|jgi:Asp-tRNA(Asn)/Glu-tRNA(Gln) amidotransferase A subunit family amidase
MKSKQPQIKCQKEQKVIDRREFMKAGGLAVGAAALLGSNIPHAHAASFSQDELVYMSASELLPLFKARKLSPVEVLKAQINRYEKVNKMVNCITYTHFDTAMDQAKESESRYMKGTARAIEGITVGIKDEHHDAGWIVTQGSNLFKNDRKDHADLIVTKLKEAGAVLPIQTTVPEFYLHGVTYTRLWGVSRCAWNLKYAVGGSSGGSGGSLSAGMCTLATGSDMGGSIRLPCAYNGLYGFKPPFGRVGTLLPLSYFAGTGPMARTFADMVMMQNVISGPSPLEPATLPKLEMPLDYPAIKGIRIAYSPNLGLTPIDEETKAGMAKAVSILRNLGAVVREVSVDPGFKGEDIGEIFLAVALGGAMGGWLAEMADRTDQMTTYAAHFVEKAASGKYGAVALNQFENLLKDFYARMAQAVFEKGYDALIMPTLPTSHIPANYDLVKGGYVLQGKKMPGIFIAALTLPWNLLNWCPVVSVPTVLSSQAMPMGMQIVGKPYEDIKVFRIAHAYEAAAPRLFSGKLIPDFRNAKHV